MQHYSSTVEFGIGKLSSVRTSKRRLNDPAARVKPTRQTGRDGAMGFRARGVHRIRKAWEQQNEMKMGNKTAVHMNHVMTYNAGRTGGNLL